jgi:hypothetical protein
MAAAFTPQHILSRIEELPSIYAWTVANDLVLDPPPERTGALAVKMAVGLIGFSLTRLGQKPTAIL